MFKKCFRDLLRDDRPAVGHILSLWWPEIPEVAANAGFEYLIFDQEHGDWTNVPLVHMLRSAEAAGILAWVRVPCADEYYIKRALDQGSAGILVPGITCAEEAQKVVDYSKFRPVGKRGACPVTRANNFRMSQNHETYFEEANKRIWVAVTIEGEEGIANFDEILEVEGVDAIHFGPVDLAVALGVPGQPTHPLVVNAVKEMYAKAKSKGKVVSMSGRNPQQLKYWADMGADYFTFVGSTDIIQEAYRQLHDDAFAYMNGERTDG